MISPASARATFRTAPRFAGSAGHEYGSTSACGIVVGQGCVYQIGAVAQPNNSNSTQADSGYFWTCDGGLAFFDPANITYDSPNVVNLTWWATGASQGVVKLPYCTPGSLSAGPYS